jgi:hypothetical protein
LEFETVENPIWVSFPRIPKIRSLVEDKASSRDEASGKKAF